MARKRKALRLPPVPGLSMVPSSFSVVQFHEASPSSHDYLGRTLDEILDWDDAKLAECDDYYHTLFPAMRNNPVVDTDTQKAFLARPELRANLKLAFRRMLKLYGFKLIEDAGGSMTVQRIPGWLDKPQAVTDWLSEDSKHPARIARIIFSLRMLGLQKEAQAFVNALCEKEIAEAVGYRYNRNWELIMGYDYEPYIVDSDEKVPSKTSTSDQPQSQKRKIEGSDVKTKAEASLTLHKRQKVNESLDQ